MSATSDPSDSGSITFALRGWQLDQRAGGAWKEIGYDLDDFDTGADGTPGECLSESPSADGEDGIDNRFGESLWPIMRTFLPSLECELDHAAARGHGTLLLQIAQWNGTGDDAVVRASLVRALDGTSGSTHCQDVDGENELLDGPGGVEVPPPAWDGGDSYCVNGASLVPATGEPLVSDVAAYLADGVLVMRPPPGAAFVLESARSNLVMRLSEAALVARLNDALDGIDGGVVTGRWNAEDLIDAGPAMGICDPGQFADTYWLLGDLRGIASAQPNLHLPCDAISVALQFSGVRAEVAGVAPTTVPPVTGCDPVTSDSAPQPVVECCSALPSPLQQDNCFVYWDPSP